MKKYKGGNMDLNRETAALLGIPFTENPWLLLGVTAGRRSQIAINSALRRRFAQLHVHPHAGSEGVDRVHAYLKKVAKDLLKTTGVEVSNARQAPNSLTPLDRAIIAALISEGGWNKNSRARLVGIAASFSITVGGLLRILEAFAEAARSGSGPLSLKQRSEHTMNRSWTFVPKKMSTASSIDSFIAKTAEKFTPELSSPSTVMTVKLAILFSFLTVVAFVLSLSVLLSEHAPSSNEESKVPQVTNAPSANQELQTREALFKQYPAFNVDGIEQSLLGYADQCFEQPSLLASLASSIHESLVNGDAPESSVLLDWNKSIDILGLGWVFIDSLTLQSAKTQIIQVLLQAEMYPGFAKQLAESIELPQLRTGYPLRVSQAIWKSGLLAALSCDLRLSAELRSLLKKMQFKEIETCDYVEARLLAMGLVTQQLLSNTEFDERSLDAWEAWIIIANQMEKVTNDVQLQIGLVTSVLSSNLDLLRVSNTRKVLGRIILETDWVSSATARDSLCDLIQSNAVSSIDLALLTSLFHYSGNTTWFNETHLVQQASSMQHRRTISSRLKKDWPIDDNERIAVWNLSLPIGLDVELVKEWNRQTIHIVEKSRTAKSQLAELRLLNEVAVSMWRGRPDLAAHALDRTKRFELDASDYFQPEYVEVDGTFSDKYRAAGQDKFDKLESIENLVKSSATDLGKHDASRLVSIALVNNRSVLRDAATKMIIEKFSNGKNVAMSLLNVFSRARSNEQITKLVANLTDVILPDPQSKSWSTSARRAFVQHALTVGNQELWGLDEIANILATSLISEYLMLNPDALPLSAEVTPNVAIEMVVDSWKRSLPPKYQRPDEPTFNSTGLLQDYLEKQLEYLLLMKSVESKWRNDDLLIDPEELDLPRLHKKKSIFEQLISVEKQISIHWLDLFADVIDEHTKRMRQ